MSLIFSYPQNPGSSARVVNIGGLAPMGKMLFTCGIFLIATENGLHDTLPGVESCLSEIKMVLTISYLAICFVYNLCVCVMCRRCLVS